MRADHDELKRAVAPGSVPRRELKVRSRWWLSTGVSVTCPNASISIITTTLNKLWDRVSIIYLLLLLQEIGLILQRFVSWISAL
jgi:hypothetical protein